MTNRPVDKRRYYYDANAMRKLVAAYFDLEDKSTGIDPETWSRYSRVYNETENILNRLNDPNCTLWPLYRLCPNGDIFESREDALKCYDQMVNERITEIICGF